jgi:hypothetical protein
MLSFVAILAICAGTLHSQQAVPEPPPRTARAVEAAAQQDARAIFEAAGVRPRRLVLLGTFHFKDAGLDAYKPTHSFDALSERRQGEIAEVIDRLDAFDADVVCVERRPDGQQALDESFESFVADGGELPANEIYQIGFRLAAREGLEGVAAVDAPARWLEPRTDVGQWCQDNGRAELLEDPYMRAGFAYLQRFDRQVDQWHLIDTLLAMNAQTRLEAGHGMYLTGAFAAGDGQEYPGVDGFVSSWHNRNLRIFQNIINASEPGDDIVLVIGAGHVPLIRHMAQCSPEFELVEVHELLGEE